MCCAILSDESLFNDKPYENSYLLNKQRYWLCCWLSFGRSHIKHSECVVCNVHHCQLYTHTHTQIQHLKYCYGALETTKDSATSKQWRFMCEHKYGRKFRITLECAFPNTSLHITPFVLKCLLFIANFA